MAEKKLTPKDTLLLKWLQKGGRKDGKEAFDRLIKKAAKPTK